MTGPEPPERPESRLRYDVVVPTVGRASLGGLLRSLALDVTASDGRGPEVVVVVDDRRCPEGPLTVPSVDPLRVVVVGHGARGGGQGPAASRNRGWRQGTSPWVCFLDDDVVVRPGWSRSIVHDLTAVDASVAAVQGRVHVPMPSRRRPTDRERNVGGLATAAWITADMAVRRTALTEIGGFDERFRRAYREDSDLALRLMDSGWQMAEGTRTIDHPVGAAPWTISVTAQRGNADDALMRRLHGADWRERARAPRGMLRDHVATTVTASAATGAAALGRSRTAGLLGAAWLAQWARFTARRVVPGPRTVREVAAMAATSALLPPAAAYWATRGELRARRLAPAGRRDRWGTRRPRAVLFDRDGTLVEDVPYNGDPGRVEPVPGVRDALDRLRRAGIAVGIVSNQSGVARGLLTAEHVEAVNARVVDLLGPFETIGWCPHGPEDGCPCRKPATGLIQQAAHRMGIDTTACAVVGDIGSDVDAGLAAGARTVMVPTSVTLAEEVTAAPEVAGSVGEAVDALLDGKRLPPGHHLERTCRHSVIEERAS